MTDALGGKAEHHGVSHGVSRGVRPVRLPVAAFLNLIEERPGIATILYRKYLEVRL